MEKLLLLLLMVLFTRNAFTSVDDLPGTIPLEFKRPPATDLFYEGKLLLPHEAYELHKSGVDLSSINPAESDLWKEQGFTAEHLEDEDRIGQNPVTYISSVVSRSGNFRFSVFQQSSSGRKFHTLMLSKKIHNVLLRAELLRKLGYRVSEVEYLKEVTIEFDSTFEKENFLKKLSEDTMGDPKRWVKYNDEQSKEIVLQDLIAGGSDIEYYNLDMGYIPDSVIRGRRVFNALLLPYALTNIPETLNQFTWHLGVVMDKYLRLDYDDCEDFSTPYEDARWILNRIKKLTIQDFHDIAKAAYLPKEVELLAVHKMVARRNSILKHFNVTASDLAYNPSITLGEFLVDGKLLKENWEGYASRFAFGDEDSPLSSSEMFYYFKSKGLSNILYNLVNLFNSKIIPTVDIPNEIYNRQLNRAFDAYRNFLLNGGSPDPVPVSVYAVPFFEGNLIASREIIAGSYLGTDNIVQLVDVIGANLGVGAYLGTDKVNLPWSLSGNVSAFVTRSYSHVRPIKSMKLAMKVPFKNILIPLHQRKIAHLLDDALAANLQDPQVDTEERQKKLSEILSSFKENLEIGESLIISDSIGAGLGANLGYQLEENLRAYIAAKGKQLVISRLHILRKDENTIHVYKDLGNMGSLGVSFGMNALIPVMKLSFESKSGSSKTRFYSLNIDDNLNKNPDIFKNIQAIRSLLLKNSLEQVKAVTKPYVIRHDFKEGSSGFSLFFVKHKGIKSKDFITITHPEGAEKYFYRRIIGHREGVDYENTFIEVLNSIFKEIFDHDDVSLSSQDGVNPGDTLYGKSYSRSVIFDAEILNPDSDNYDANGDVGENIVNVMHRWKGWKISRKKAQKILNELNAKYDSELFPKHVLNEATDLELYQVLLFLNFYPFAIDNMLNMPRDQVRRIFKAYPDEKNLFDSAPVVPNQEPDLEQLIEGAITSFLHNRKKIFKYRDKRDLAKISHYTAKLISVVEGSLKIKGMMEISGGEKGLFVYSRLEGFRANDEAGDKPFISNSIGQIGSFNFKGPLYDLHDKIGMSESEFYGYWIQDRL